MMPTVTIAPVRKSIRVNASQAHAFDVFTSGLGRWWPLDHGIGKTPRKAAVMETRVGGHWYELAEDGTRTNVGKVINSRWQPDTTVSSEVEVRFIADGANATRVELEHRKFEQMGAEPGESMRKDVDRGWPGLLETFKQRAEAA